MRGFSPRCGEWEWARELICDTERIHLLVLLAEHEPLSYTTEKKCPKPKVTNLRQVGGRKCLLSLFTVFWYFFSCPKFVICTWLQGTQRISSWSYEIKMFAWDKGNLICRFLQKTKWTVNKKEAESIIPLLFPLWNSAVWWWFYFLEDVETIPFAKEGV